jgi:hypothetical protein
VTEQAFIVISGVGSGVDSGVVGAEVVGAEVVSGVGSGVGAEVVSGVSRCKTMNGKVHISGDGVRIGVRGGYEVEITLALVSIAIVSCKTRHMLLHSGALHPHHRTYSRVHHCNGTTAHPL